MQDAQSASILWVENFPAPLCSISMGGKNGDYTYYIGELPQSKSVGFASSLGEGAFGIVGRFLIAFDTLVTELTACALSVKPCQA